MSATEMSNSVLKCIICLENYINTEEILITNCGHIFHKECFEERIARLPKCPQCRIENPTTHRICLTVEVSARVNELERIMRDLRNQLEIKTKNEQAHTRLLRELQIQLDTSISHASDLQNRLEETDRNFLYMAEQCNKSDMTLREKVNEYNIKIAELNSQIDQNRNLQNQLADSDRNFLNLHEQYNSINDHRKDEANEIKDLQTKLRESEDKCLALQVRKFESKLELAELKSKAEELNNFQTKLRESEYKLQQQKCENMEQLAELESKTEAFNNLQTKLRETEEKLIALQQQKLKSELELAELKSKADELNNLQTKLRETEEKLIVLQQQKCQNAEQLAELKTKTDEINDLQNKLRVSEDKFITLQECYKRTTSEREAQSQSAKDNELQLKQYIKNMDILQLHLKESEKKFEKKFITLQAHHDETEENHNAEIKEFELILENCKKEKEELRIQNFQLQTQNKELTNVIKEEKKILNIN